MQTGSDIARSPGRRSDWLGLAKSLRIVVPLGLIGAIVLACFLAPVLFSIPDPVGGSILLSNSGIMSPGYVLGTDLNGDDVLSRLLYGGRVSLQIAFAVNLIGLFVGGLLGAASAYIGGLLDALAMRCLDVLISFPSLVLVIVIAQTLGPSTSSTILAMAILSVPVFARVARASVARLAAQPFTKAAFLCGTSHSRMLIRHFAPIVFPQLVVFGLLGMGIVITVEGALSFLGLGVPLPNPSWGNMIAHGQQALLVSPRLVIIPCVAVFLTVLCFNQLGEELRQRHKP
jgi:peptide/nickel transport system permease protein